MSTTATTPTPIQATDEGSVHATPRAADNGTFLHYIRRGNGPRRGMTPQVEAALRAVPAREPRRGEDKGGRT